MGESCARRISVGHRRGVFAPCQHRRDKSRTGREGKRIEMNGNSLGVVLSSWGLAGAAPDSSSRPDSEVVVKAKRRTFSTERKIRIRFRKQTRRRTPDGRRQPTGHYRGHPGRLSGAGSAAGLLLLQTPSPLLAFAEFPAAAGPGAGSAREGNRAGLLARRTVSGSLARRTILFCVAQ